jgi:hypothetical protein
MTENEKELIEQEAKDYIVVIPETLHQARYDAFRMAEYGYNLAKQSEVKEVDKWSEYLNSKEQFKKDVKEGKFATGTENNS